MIHVIPYITRDQTNELLERVNEIVAVIQPVMVVCFGIRNESVSSWSCFNSTDYHVSKTCYDLLIVTKKSAIEHRDDVFNLVSNLNNSSLRVSPVIHSIYTLKDELRKGNYFFSTVVEGGISLYNSIETEELCSLSKSSTDPLCQVEPNWNNRIQLASDFLKTAVYSFNEKGNKVALLLLHQAVEHCCIALIHLHIGYRAATHKLSRLIELCENFTLEFREIFSRNSEEEVHLFKVLERAYSDSRYKEGYAVEDYTVTLLINKVTRFLEIASGLSKERMSEIGGNNQEDNKFLKYEKTSS
jgi:HEPN domain-containing protein